MSYTIDITDDASPLVRRLGRAIRVGALTDAMRRGAVNRVKNHIFALKDTKRNRLGARSTGFYSSAAKATHSTSEPGEITITVSKQGFRQRLEGGRITAIKSKLLTIPATAEAHGKRASEFKDLQFVVLGGRPALVRAKQTRLKIGGRRKDGTRTIRGRETTTGLEVLYWLKKSVLQKPDPSVMPPRQEIVAAALQSGGSYVAGIESRRGN